MAWFVVPARRMARGLIPTCAPLPLIPFPSTHGECAEGGGCPSGTSQETKLAPNEHPPGDLSPSVPLSGTPALPAGRSRKAQTRISIRAEAGALKVRHTHSRS